MIFRYTIHSTIHVKKLLLTNNIYVIIYSSITYMLCVVLYY